MVIENKYDIGQTVYLITDEDQSPRIVTCILVCPMGILYELSCGPNNSRHYDFEISDTQNVLTKTA